MKMPWRIKSALFRCVDRFHLERMLYFLQRSITRRSQTKLKIHQNWVRHKEALLKYECTNLIFEFGAGKNLAQNIYLSTVVHEQLVVDLNPMLDLDLVNRTRLYLGSELQLRSNKKIESIGSLKYYGISYQAPFDASRTELETGSIDACISTNTLEHIPQDSLRKIFKELSRVMKSTGIVSAKIDYTDHYAHTDSSISLLNFLFFDDDQWRRYNHNCHYQNRLRHSDYKKIFDDCGFDVIEEEIAFGEKNIPRELIQKFKHEDESWSATGAHLVLKKR